MDNSLFSLLRSKDIIAILDGDTDFGDYMLADDRTVKIALPYQSGKELCDISTRFGLPKVYTWNGVNQSRWQYVDELLEYCINKGRCSDLLSFLFSKKQYAKVLNGHAANEIEAAYVEITQKVLNGINGLLYFGGNELCVVGSQFVVKPIGSKVEMEAPQIKTIDREYIRNMSNRANQDIEQGNYDSAITHARTLLEETFCYVLEKEGVEPSTSGNMAELYKQVKNAYELHNDANIERCINTLYSGLNSIVSAISEMRNKDSDSHGVGSKRVDICDYHARLFVNSATAMSEFILSVSNKNS